MTDMPETIYVTPHEGFGGGSGSYQNHQSFYNNRIEYTRSDLHAAQVAECAALREALRDMLNAIDHGNDYDEFLLAANNSGWAAAHLTPAYQKAAKLLEEAATIEALKEKA